MILSPFSSRDVLPFAGFIGSLAPKLRVDPGKSGSPDDCEFALPLTLLRVTVGVPSA